MEFSVAKLLVSVRLSSVEDLKIGIFEAEVHQG